MGYFNDLDDYLPEYAGDYTTADELRAVYQNDKAIRLDNLNWKNI